MNRRVHPARDSAVSIATVACIAILIAKCGVAWADSEGVASPEKPIPEQTVEGQRPWDFNKWTRYAHSLPEVTGSGITVTKKTSVVDLDAQPAIIDNNQRELFDRLPGIVLAEQQNPTQLNISYRGLGNPQESEYVLLMRDGIPMELDWIGFPTLYTLPVPQTIQSVQMIRGGSGLLYGPEPQPVVNFVSRAPVADRPWAGTSEQVGGSHDLFSSFNRLSGSSGTTEYLVDYSRRQSAGERENGRYTLNSGDLHVGSKLTTTQHLSIDFHAYALESGLAGLMSFAQYHADRHRTTTPNDLLNTNHYSGALTYEVELTSQFKFTQRAWVGYQDLFTRSDRYAGGGAPTAMGGTLAEQRFHFTGLDGRSVYRWGSGNALTLGYTAYYSKSPFHEFNETDAMAENGSEEGVPFYRDQRRTRYGALFAENVFRLPYIHIVTSARVDHEQLDTHETLALHPSLINASYVHNIPQFGLGIGNDFGHGNETYLNVSQGYRPMRYLDVASPFSNFSPHNAPVPTQYLTYEMGVHGWPRNGLYYDVSLFEVNVKNRIESRAYSLTETVDVNTGSTRHRGLEAEGSVDLLAFTYPTDDTRHFDLFANVSFLDAHFTDSAVVGQVGKTPAYAPRYVIKAGISLRETSRYKASLLANFVGAQYFQDSDLGVAGTPAKIPSYGVLDVAGEYSLKGQLRLIGGISNLTNRRYYSRVFLFGGSLEPSNAIAIHAGAALDF